MRSTFPSKLVYQTFNGHVLSQFKKVRRSQAQDRRTNWKHATYLIRLLESGISVLETGGLTLRTEHREALLEIRAGTWPWDRVDDWRKALHERAHATTRRPDRPDTRAVDAYRVRTRTRALGDHA